MLRDLLTAWRIVRAAKKDGYDGDFAIVREPIMEELQLVYGRAIAENKQYMNVVAEAIQGYPVCKYCQDYDECKAAENWQEESCDFFLLRFPDDKEAKDAFNECYNECNKDCNKEAHDG